MFCSQCKDTRTTFLLSIRAKDQADQQEAMANLSQNTGNAGTTSLGALLRAKLDNN